VIDLLHETSLEKLAKAVESGKYRLADLPGEMFPRPADLQ
jgi:hypothetical protein